MKFLFPSFQNYLEFIWIATASIVERRSEFTCPPTATRKMAVSTGPNDWRDQKVREWLLLLLRFAVTHERSDQTAVLAMADELDSLNVSWRPMAPSFFLRTSSDVCEALLSAKKGNANAVLRQHASRIDDLRLRQAFEAAAGFHFEGKPRQKEERGRKNKARDLWKGLRIR